MPATPEQVRSLKRPTPDTEKKTRPGPGGTRLTYVDARYHMDVLDDGVGPMNWQDAFERDSKGALRAGIGVLCERYDGDQEGVWVWKWDTGTPSTMEPQKGEYSDALKRAGVQWGISRDLYDSTVEASGTRAPVASRPAPTAATAPTHTSSGWSCPVHGTVKVVPAGISKRTNKAYPAFEVCGQSGCDEKPPRGTRKPQPVMVAPEPSEYVGMGVDDDDEDFGSLLGEDFANSGGPDIPTY